MTPPSTPSSAEQIADAIVSRFAWTSNVMLDGRLVGMQYAVRDAIAAALSDAVKRTTEAEARGPMIDAKMAFALTAAEAALASSETARRELEKALRPFANICLDDETGAPIGHGDISGPDLSITAKDVRRARAALAANPEGKPDAGVTEALRILGTFMPKGGNLNANISVPLRGLFELRKALASAVPTAPETIPGQWQSMETAPKDGTRIFAYGVHGNPTAADIERGVVPGDHWWGVVCWDLWREPHRWVFSKDGTPAWSEPTHYRLDVFAAPAVSQPPADTRETGNG